MKTKDLTKNHHWSCIQPNVLKSQISESEWDIGNKIGFLRSDKKSVLQDWVTDRCSIRMQGTLLSAIRGCDGVAKEDISKKFVRALRYNVLNSPVGYPTRFLYFDIKEEDIVRLLDHPDQYELHWLLHFMQAAEVIGWMHPDIKISLWWHSLYTKIVNMLHLNPEKYEQFCSRLHDDDKGDTLMEYANNIKHTQVEESSGP